LLVDLVLEGEENEAEGICVCFTEHLACVIIKSAQPF
jgi:hypothetical protein